MSLVFHAIYESEKGPEKGQVDLDMPTFFYDPRPAHKSWRLTSALSPKELPPQARLFWFMGTTLCWAPKQDFEWTAKGPRFVSSRLRDCVATLPMFPTHASDMKRVMDIYHIM